MNGESCTKTFENKRIGDSIEKILYYDRENDVAGTTFSIPNDDLSFQVVKIDVSEYNDGSGPSARAGKATMNIYFKRPGSFVEKLEMSECSASDTSGCFFDRCILDLEPGNSGTSNTDIGKCHLLTCSDGTSSASAGAPPCYKVTQDVHSNRSQTLVGCGTTQSHSFEYSLAYGYSAGDGSKKGKNTYMGYKVGKYGVSSNSEKNTYLGMSLTLNNNGKWIGKTPFLGERYYFGRR